MRYYFSVLDAVLHLASAASWSAGDLLTERPNRLPSFTCFLTLHRFSGYLYVLSSLA